MQLNQLSTILKYLRIFPPGLEIAYKKIAETGSEGEAEIFGQGTSKLINASIFSERANVRVRDARVREGGSKRDSRFALKLQHKDMIGAMQEVKASSHLYLVNVVFLTSFHWMATLILDDVAHVKFSVPPFKVCGKRLCRGIQ